MQAKIDNRVRTLVEILGLPKERSIPARTIGIVVEAYESPQGEGYAVDFALPDDSFVGGLAYANAYLEPDQFEVVNDI